MSQFTKICIEKTVERGGYFDYNEAYKINLSHYKKVIKAKFDKAILNFPSVVRFEERNEKISKDDIKEGYFISCCLHKDQFNLGHRFNSYVQKDNLGLFVIEWRTYSGKLDANYISHKYYLDVIGGIELIWREPEIEIKNHKELFNIN